ncbi:MAG: prolipoprotein diacylglyceryl transferase, partial [Allobaculum sp.]|nr:prolipoprotein diacylglyceryl transferase [Allobaculum sp.]
TQLIMSVFDFALGFFLQWFSSKKTFQGELGALYLIAYSVGRFIIEFWRGDGIRGVVNGLSTSQYLGILMAVVGIFLWWWGRKHASRASL